MMMMMIMIMMMAGNILAQLLDTIVLSTLLHCIIISSDVPEQQCQHSKALDGINS